jgi:hypothetical protein
MAEFYNQPDEFGRHESLMVFKQEIDFVALRA